MPHPEIDHLSEPEFAAPNRILLATDLTDADYLLPHAIAQAKACGARVTVIHAVSPAILMPAEIGVAPYVDEAALDEDIEVSLQGLARKIEARGVACETLLQHGPVANVIREATASSGASRLIMATHGRGKAQQFVLGSVAQTLLRSMIVPIFTVGPHAHDSRQVLPRRILHPVSLVGNYQAAALLAMDVAEAYNAELTLLHVNSATRYSSRQPPPCSGDQITEAIAALAPRARGLNTPIRVSVKTGHVVGEILNTALETRADWILLGVDGDLPFWPLQDSTAYKVVAAAHCPVLSLRHERKQPQRAEQQESRFSGVSG